MTAQKDFLFGQQPVKPRFCSRLRREAQRLVLSILIHPPLNPLPSPQAPQAESATGSATREGRYMLLPFPESIRDRGNAHMLFPKIPSPHCGSVRGRGILQTS
jgi:hypothetical protein